MKKTLIQACALCVGATAVQAGGIDRSGQGVNILFEEGSAVQFRLGYASPDISGTMTIPGLGGMTQATSPMISLYRIWPTKKR
ncbi:MAG: hypothetical protein ACR2O2_06740 [Ruegeria sp.]